MTFLGSHSKQLGKNLVRNWPKAGQNLVNIWQNSGRVGLCSTYGVYTGWFIGAPRRNLIGNLYEKYISAFVIEKMTEKLIDICQKQKKRLKTSQTPP